MRISLDALTSRTAQLPGIRLDRPKRVIGKNTEDCMRSGIMYGTAAMLDGMLDRGEEELGVSDGAYPVCPRCAISLDREYQRFCDRCGQRLGWQGYKKARIIHL